MGDVLITGLPRSGTTLAISILSRAPNAIALAEPFSLDRSSSRGEAVDQIVGLMRQCRLAAVAGAALPTKHVDGMIPDNWVEQPHEDARLRRVLEERGALHFDKSLSGDFTLVAKHPAEFTALADLLVDRFPLFAIIRDPMAVLAAWQTVDMPINRGRMPMLECFAPGDLKQRLSRMQDPLERQIALLEFQLRTYLSLGRERVIRYEDLVENPQRALEPIGVDIPAQPSVGAYDPIERYGAVDFGRLADHLRPILPLVEEFYPAFRAQWRTYFSDTRSSAGDGSKPDDHALPQGDHAADPPRVFVMGAYIAAGGTHMAYDIGRIAHQSLGLQGYAVQCGKESFRQSAFEYPVRFESVARDDLPDMVRPQDLLICNPSFSDGTIGLTHGCRKLMYVQGFSTFSTLDLWFDQHVSVSGFVRDFLINVYGLETPIIQPFVTISDVEPKSWWSRDSDSLWVYLKGNGKRQAAMLDRFRQEMRRLDPAKEAAIDWDNSILRAGGSLKQQDLLSRIGDRRHLIVLSTCEGFGLVPLEAMAMGTTVLGLDGFGGRDYMRPGENCLVRSYPDLAGVAADLVHCLRSPEQAAMIAAAGPPTAMPYSRDNFEARWRDQLVSIMGTPYR